MPLAPAPSVPSAGPSAPAGSTGGPMGPGVMPTGASQGAGAGAVPPPPAPVPVSAARMERDAIAVSSTAAALQRKQAGNDPLAVARRIGAALNMGHSKDPGFYWVTGLTKDGAIVVANTYGLGYIPDGVKLPESVKLASADESIPAGVRGSWATYPIVALHGWAQHHDTTLRAVIATEDQFKGFDPGAAPIILQPDDIPETGQMQGRDRLTVISPDVSARLMKMSDAALMELLPPASVDVEGPQNRRVELLLEVFRPLLSSDPGRIPVQLEAMVSYADHMQELAIHSAHTAADGEAQRSAIADWLYWQHLGVLTSDALAGAS
ncbi:secretion protein EccK [Mycobacterium aquaticum]|uniref:Secretion protein EccK n=2 Tax=Mycobacterium aquaticum TaxID=1927124 RepID=A0A1X0ACN6_9MYCO|nr:secretion protein EccK [Mycobacterium aquaticum]